jgi:hypothetical protein
LLKPEFPPKLEPLPKLLEPPPKLELLLPKPDGCPEELPFGLPGCPFCMALEICNPG